MIRKGFLLSKRRHSSKVCLWGPIGDCTSRSRRSSARLRARRSEKSRYRRSAISSVYHCDIVRPCAFCIDKAAYRVIRRCWAEDELAAMLESYNFKEKTCPQVKCTWLATCLAAFGLAITCDFHLLRPCSLINSALHVHLCLRLIQDRTFCIAFPQKGQRQPGHNAQPSGRRVRVITDGIRQSVKT